jgi:uncharacterized OsmC-like protein
MNPQRKDAIMPELTFQVAGNSENPTKLNVETRTFKFVVDEPADLGGTDHGPNPVEYVLGALAGCLNVVGHVVANEMNMPLKGITISIEGDLDPARFMGMSNEKRAGYSQIRVGVTPDSSADEATLTTWLKSIEDRCPVSDNLRNPTDIAISLV